ncbi:MAG: hypothetical protein WC319_00465 [Candidatus Paceibacterota bacterium]|jgi:hypothetical protein
MQININRKQYLILLTTIGATGIIYHTLKGGDKKIQKKFDELCEVEKYLLSLAKDIGCGDMVINIDGESDVSEKFAMEGVEDMWKFQEFLFQNKLAEQLGCRDFCRRYTERETKKMSEEEILAKILECIAKYADEFEEHDMQRLEINKG